MERIKVTVNRSTWLRGEGAQDSFLHRARDGKMCCLGSVLMALGVAQSTMTGVKTPAARNDSLSAKLNPMTFVPYNHRERFIPMGLAAPLLALSGESGNITEHEAVGFAMEANDDIYSDDSCRERTIAMYLAEVGIDVEFVDGPAR